MKYKGVTLLKRNLTPSFDTGFSHDVNEKILDRLVAWAEKKNTKTIAVERLILPGEAFKLNVDEVIKIGVPGIGNIEFGVWQVYGDPHMKENSRGRHRYLDWKKQTEEAAEESSKRKRKKSVYDMSPEEKKQMVADMMKKGVVVESADRTNPRKKEMKMGTPDKKFHYLK